MDDAPGPRPPASPASGTTTPRRLEQAPGARLAAPSTGSAPRQPAASPIEVVAVSVLVAIMGAVILFIVGNLDIGAGLVALSAAVGWITGLAMAEGRRGRGGYPPGPARMVIAAVIAAFAVGGALLALGVYAIVQGGVLNPVEYLATVYGPLALLDVIAAAGVAAIRAR